MVSLQEQDAQRTKEMCVFHRIKRHLAKETAIAEKLENLGLPVKTGKTLLEKTTAFDIISANIKEIKDEGILIQQKKDKGKKYFIGKSSLSVDINEGHDWFDIHAQW